MEILLILIFTFSSGTTFREFLITGLGEGNNTMSLMEENYLQRPYILVSILTQLLFSQIIKNRTFLKIHTIYYVCMITVQNGLTTKILHENVPCPKDCSHSSSMLFALPQVTKGCLLRHVVDLLHNQIYANLSRTFHIQPCCCM